MENGFLTIVFQTQCNGRQAVQSRCNCSLAVWYSLSSWNAHQGIYVSHFRIVLVGSRYNIARCISCETRWCLSSQPQIDSLEVQSHPDLKWHLDACQNQQNWLSPGIYFVHENWWEWFSLSFWNGIPHACQGVWSFGRWQLFGDRIWKKNANNEWDTPWSASQAEMRHHYHLRKDGTPWGAMERDALWKFHTLFCTPEIVGLCAENFFRTIVPKYRPLSFSWCGCFMCKFLRNEFCTRPSQHAEYVIILSAWRDEVICQEKASENQ